MWMRYWLASGGINPDKDVNLITIPPAQMVANMKVDKMDGFCVGEPWNSRAIADKIGFTAITTQQMWKDHPEKVCAFTEEFATKNPKTVKAILKALHLSSAYIDKMENRQHGRCRFADDLHQLSARDHSRPPAGQVRLRRRPQGTGSELHDLLAARVQLSAEDFRLLVAQPVPPLGNGEGRAGLRRVVKKVMRQDIYLEAMKDMGVTPKVQDMQKSSCSMAVRSERAGEIRAVVSSPQPGVSRSIDA